MESSCAKLMSKEQDHLGTFVLTMTSQGALDRIGEARNAPFRSIMRISLSEVVCLWWAVEVVERQLQYNGNQVGGKMRWSRK